MKTHSVGGWHDGWTRFQSLKPSGFHSELRSIFWWPFNQNDLSMKTRANGVTANSERFVVLFFPPLPGFNASSEETVGWITCLREQIGFETFFYFNHISCLTGPAAGSHFTALHARTRKALKFCDPFDVSPGRCGVICGYRWRWWRRTPCYITANTPLKRYNRGASGVKRGALAK